MKLSVLTSLSILPLFLLAACDDSGNNSAPTAAVAGTIVEQKTLQIGGPEPQMVTLGKGGSRAELTFPANVLPSRAPVTVRLSSGVTKAGATVPSGTVVQIATVGLTFLTPVKMRQPAPAAPPRKHYASVSAVETGDTWVTRSLARATGVASAEGELFEVDISGSGLWALALVDDAVDIVDGGTPDAGTVPAADGGVVVRPDAGPVTAFDASPTADVSGSEKTDSAIDTAPPAPAPQFGSMSPTGGVASTAVSLVINGSGFLNGATVFFNGQPLPTTFESATSLQADVPAALTTIPGSIAVWVSNVANDARTSSSPLYFTVTAAVGAPQIRDYSPDNGLPGDKIRIIGINFSAEPITIKDGLGNVIQGDAPVATTWAGESVESVEFTLVDTIKTGALTVSNSKGSFQGKIFNVGQNLTRVPGTIVEASSNYNTTNWFKTSGGDNDLQTSWFSAIGDCATDPSCTTVPFFLVTLPQPQTVARIAMRGNREWAEGYDFVRGRFELMGANDTVLWGASYDLPEPDRDIDIQLQVPVPNVLKVKFASEADVSTEPGFSELEIFGP